MQTPADKLIETLVTALNDARTALYGEFEGTDHPEEVPTIAGADAALAQARAYVQSRSAASPLQRPPSYVAPQPGWQAFTSAQPGVMTIRDGLDRIVATTAGIHEEDQRRGSPYTAEGNLENSKMLAAAPKLYEALDWLSKAVSASMESREAADWHAKDVSHGLELAAEAMAQAKPVRVQAKVTTPQAAIDDFFGKAKGFLPSGRSTSPTLDGPEGLRLSINAAESEPLEVSLLGPDGAVLVTEKYADVVETAGMGEFRPVDDEVSVQQYALSQTQIDWLMSCHDGMVDLMRWQKVPDQAVPFNDPPRRVVVRAIGDGAEVERFKADAFRTLRNGSIEFSSGGVRRYAVPLTHEQIDSGSMEQMLISAAERGLTATVDVLLANGANIHASGDYAIVRASMNGHADTVSLLLDRGADIHAGDDLALRVASEEGHNAVVKVLLDRGADVHAGADGALRWATKAGHSATVAILQAYAAKPAVTDARRTLWVRTPGLLKVSVTDPTDGQQMMCEADAFSVEPNGRIEFSTLDVGVRRLAGPAEQVDADTLATMWSRATAANRYTIELLRRPDMLAVLAVKAPKPAMPPLPSANKPTTPSKGL